jgi:hypothetical protein
MVVICAGFAVHTASRKNTLFHFVENRGAGHVIEQGPEELPPASFIFWYFLV